MPVEETTDQSVNQLIQLAKTYKPMPVTQWEALAQSGSHRRYYRLHFEDGTTCIGAYNQDVAENHAFFSYTRSFSNRQLNVPQLFAIAKDEQHYLQTDLGDVTLYDFLCKNRNGAELSPEVIRFYEKTVQNLPLIQLAGAQDCDFSLAYPRAAFDRQSMQWDLNYFKYFFLKLVNIPFHEQALEDDFNTLMDYLLSADCHYFLYRDFQSRNIMLHNEDVYFIDYQGGREGALQYDIASLLCDAKADLPMGLRKHLLTLYIEELSKHIPVDKDRFIAYFEGYVLIRILQSFGAYGYRGYFERKQHFLQSIPFAARNLENVLNSHLLPIEIPELERVLTQLVQSDFVKPYQPKDGLTVLVQSFSYKVGIPQDPSPNGGGFVFDCRALPNPGREKRFARNTGRQDCVIEYLEKFPAIHEFKNNVFSIVDQAVDNYLERHFTHLMVSFGCTGGQHRSVYFAEQLAKHLQEKYPSLNVDLKHIELIKKF